MPDFKKTHIALAVCTMAVLFVLGCGKKGPPVPPEIRGNKLAAPYDLKYKAGDNELVLLWKHKIDKENAKLEPEGFNVFMAEKTFEECEGCPFVYKLTGFVSMPDKTFSVPVKKGFKYYFRVQAVDEDGIKSGYSKTVQFESK